jgi:hypothetical protein
VILRVISGSYSERAVRLSGLDERFITDEVAGMLYSATGNRLMGYSVVGKEARLSRLSGASATTLSAVR